MKGWAAKGKGQKQKVTVFIRDPSPKSQQIKLFRFEYFNWFFICNTLQIIGIIIISA